MGFFNKMLGKKDLGVNASDADHNLTYAEYLKEEFGLQLVEGAWVFDRGVTDEFVAQLSDPKKCLPFLKNIQTTLPFDKACIVVSNKMVPIVINTKPKAACLISGLDGKGAANLIDEVIKNSGKQVSECMGTWVFEL